jgi:hypothetical protein
METNDLIGKIIIIKKCKRGGSFSEYRYIHHNNKNYKILIGNYKKFIYVFPTDDILDIKELKFLDNENLKNLIISKIK